MKGVSFHLPFPVVITCAVFVAIRVKIGVCENGDRVRKNYRGAKCRITVKAMMAGFALLPIFLDIILCVFGAKEVLQKEGVTVRNGAESRVGNGFVAIGVDSSRKGRVLGVFGGFGKIA